MTPGLLVVPSQELARGAAPARSQASRPLAVDTASIAVIHEAARSDAFEARLTALEIIGERRLTTLVPDVAFALGDPDHDVRLAAVRALVALEDRDALALLGSVRDDEKESLDIRALAASALVNPRAEQGGPQ
jgi:HEAT repeat protein